MDRRSFFKASIASAGGAAVTTSSSFGSESKPYQMKYRTLGRTGLKVSEVSIGTYGFENTPVLEAAIKRGVNLICTCRAYQNGNAERAVAPLVKKYRDKMILNSGIHCNKMISESDFLAALDQSLEAMGVKQVEIYRAHQIEKVEEVLNPEIHRALEKAKKSGKIKFAAMSTHAKNDKIIEAAIDLGYFDVIQCRYNFMEYPLRRELFDLAAEKGIGVIAFKIAAGKMESEVEAIQKKGFQLDQARIRWALQNENVHSACVHFPSFADIDKNIEAVGKTLSLEDDFLLEEYRQAFDNSFCRFCGQCEPDCPKGVKVADVMRYRMYYKKYGFEKEAITRYSELPLECKADNCLDCSEPVCQKRCPNNLATRDNLLEAQRILSV